MRLEVKILKDEMDNSIVSFPCSPQFVKNEASTTTLLGRISELGSDMNELYAIGNFYNQNIKI